VSPNTQLTDKIERSWTNWFITLPTISLLLLVLVINAGELIHGQFLKMGEHLFSDNSQHVQYFLLRADPEKPTCNPNVDLETEVARQMGGKPASAKGDIDDLFEEAKPQDAASVRESMKTAIQDCKDKQSLYEHLKGHITPQLKAYRAAEESFFTLFKFGAENRPLILILLLTVTAAYTTLGFHHICLRPPRHARDYMVQSISMLIANSAMLYSTIRYYQISMASGAPVDDVNVFFMWMGLFGTMMLVSIARLIKPPKPLSSEPGSWSRTFECVPLVASMGIATSVYFFANNHPSGPAIYAHKMLDIISLPLALSLHIWAGMLFKQSRLVDMFMNILRPWRLSPEVLTYIILLAAGLPTAYAGASSVFVIAAGALIYHEIRAVGGTSQFALAATAMSGSLGAVLRPSLLVVGIAALNRQVTTAQLFYWGGYVFALTSTMFFIASQLHRHNRHVASQLAPVREALPAMLREIKVVLPYVAIIAAVALFYSEALDSPFNEISAPGILPVMMLVVLTFDKRMELRDLMRMPRAVGAAVVQPMHPRGGAEAPVLHAAPQAHAAKRKRGAIASIHAATTETVEHVGAYIMLMLFTQLVSGMIERSEVMDMAPQHFPNVWLAMGFLVVAKVILGMVMEPIGAIMLVSSTLAPMAYANGIEPVHFWMMVLVAFELGYLLPPVALNQLLTRQVVGEAEIDRADHEVEGLSFYRRYERWILPSLVMSISLGMVAFVPLMVQRFAIFKPVLDWFQ
jgi:TRAP-type C4-dicarboxylate transport system permease large subunit